MAVYLIGRSIGYTRAGIDDVGDIYEVFDGPEAPSGPGYALSEIIRVEVLDRADVESVLDAIRPSIDFDPVTKKEYWQNPGDGEWYEVKIRPKYGLNFASLTLGDKAILANENSTSMQQIAALGKIIANVSKYAENTQTLKPTG
jgi:hypothetical protein